MKKSELKLLIKECVKEVLFDEGVLSNLVAEVAMGITKAQSLMTESHSPAVSQLQEKSTEDTRRNLKEEEQEKKRKRLLETKRKMLDAMGNTKMANVFEGTQPLKSSGAPNASPNHSPLSGHDPSDSGVDITGLFGLAGQKWNQLK